MTRGAPALPALPIVPPVADVAEPLVSVVIDNYNYGRYLGDAIDSALAQTHPRVEVIVVDDGSTDGSRDVIESYGDKVHAVFQANAGQAAAMNAGLRAVSGEVTIMLDADDLLDADVAERAVAEFAAERSCVRVQWRMRCCDAGGNPLPAMEPPRHHALVTGDLRGYVARHHLFRAPPASGNAWSTAALRRIPPVPEDVFRQYVDRWWSELTSLVGTLRALDRPGGTYRVHAGGHSRSMGRGFEYFDSRIALTDHLHVAGRALTATLGGPAYEPTAGQTMDAAYMGWRIARHKVAPARTESVRSLARLAVRGSWGTAIQPGLSPRSRLGRIGWLLAVTAAPRGTSLAGRIAAFRYGG